MSNIKVLLTTEGTYPFHQGGVSTWCDILVKELKSVDYVIYSILMDPFVTQKFALPDNTGLIKVPLWGTEEPSEHLSESFSKSFLAKRRTTPKEIETRFIPLFSRLIEEIIASEKDPRLLAQTMLELHLYFDEYEYKVSFKSETAWETFKRIINTKVAESRGEWARPDLYCLIQSLGWIYRFMNILNTPFPKVDVTHASAAAFCGIPCVLSKLKYDTPFLLTEHGIYLREQYLGLSKNNYSSFLNTFLIRLIHSITSLNYTFADQVSPVCEYNTRWEKKFDVDPRKIQVIYNGVDKNVFMEAKPRAEGRPTVVTVARIDPLKDIVTLIKSAAVVKSRIPDVQFIIYGSVSVKAYYEECLELRSELELADTVIFAGHTSNMAAAYESGDIVALTSISEAFPYSVVEAMMCARAVISTDVGGIREAVGETGILVTPRDYDELADGIVKLLLDRELRNQLANDARERALTFFTLDRVLEMHERSYRKLAEGVTEQKTVAPEPISVSARRKQQRLFAERAFAFMSNGMYMDAVRHFKLAVMANPDSAAAPALLVEAAEAYNQLGMFDRAFLTMEKHRALVKHIESRIIA
ncbi:GT4 family glycosyltransferase PelF [Paenibacillus thermotolerans]|uniref:GT4 family glycosyltransferase PelF n=1 Tax=Paenibacillus thermotolerans TaxID=3027807 RepID=UPI0023679102|nr:MULTISPECIES: GT4 family glycosyltransferase PelF [unclassified Paenibacillus]